MVAGSSPVYPTGAPLANLVDDFEVNRGFRSKPKMLHLERRTLGERALPAKKMVPIGMCFEYTSLRTIMLMNWEEA